jgi:hypothetical protein
MAAVVGLQSGLSRWRRVIAAVCVSLGLLGGMAWLAPVGAEDNQVTIGVGDTTLFVSGLTSPNAFVAIMDNHGVIGTAIADNYGNYIKDFSAFAPGIHQLSVYARDADGRLTDTAELQVNVAEHAQTDVSIFLPPTLSIVNPEVNHGEHVHLMGSTLASGRLTITLDGTIYFQVQADSGGDWSYELDTASLSAGSHSLYVVASEESSGRQSYPTGTRTITITVKAEPVPPFPIAAAPPSQRPSPPVITYPSPGSTITDSQLVVRGTAQPGTQVELFNGERSIGSTFTDRWGNWRISIALTEPEYLIKARACRQTLCSKFSEGVRFFYRPPRGAGDFTAYLEKYRYMSQVGESLALRLHIEGGRSPYRVVITWCGGRQEVLSTAQSELTLSHIYRKADACIGRVTVEERGGRSVHLSFSVLVVGGTAFPLLWLLLLLLLLILLALLLMQKHQHKKRNHN